MFRFARDTHKHTHTYKKREMSKLHYHDYAFVGLKMKMSEKVGQVSIRYQRKGKYVNKKASRMELS